MRCFILISCLAACGHDTAPATLDGPASDAAPDATTAPAPGIRFFDYGIAVDITPDGHFAAFEDISGIPAKLVLHDTFADTIAVVAEVGDPTRDIATGISQTGRVTALHADPVQAGIWDAAAGWRDLGSPYAAGCDQDLSSAWDVSADGTRVVGLAWNGCSPAAFLWSNDAFTPLQVLGTASAHAPTNRATVISDDGTVIAGFAEHDMIDRSAAVWNAADGTGVLLAPDENDSPSEVLAISGDGKTLAGAFGLDGFVWTLGTGRVILQRFAIALPSDEVFPNAVTGDGEFVFGGVGSQFFTVPNAFVWSARDGMRPLTDVAIAAGIAIPTGMLLGNVLGASADGTVLIGTATDMAGNPKTFTLRLPASALE